MTGGAGDVRPSFWPGASRATKLCKPCLEHVMARCYTDPNTDKVPIALDRRWPASQSTHPARYHVHDAEQSCAHRVTGRTIFPLCCPSSLTGSLRNPISVS
jgi:hypothetical protein